MIPILLAQPASAQSEANPITIDVVLPLDGVRAAIGNDARVAAELAIKAFNADGGIHGRQVVARFHSDSCTDAGGRRAAADVVGIVPPATAVIGHPCPAAAHAAAPIYNAKGILFITAGNLPSRAGVTQRSGLLHFRIPSESPQGQVLGDILADTPPDQRLALVRDKTLYSTVLMQQAFAVLSRARKTPVLIEVINGGDKDFSDLAQRIAAAKVTHVGLAAFPSESGLLIAELVKASPDIRILGSDSLAVTGVADFLRDKVQSLEVLLAPDAAAFRAADAIVPLLNGAGAAASRQALAMYAALEVWRSASVAAGANVPGLIAEQLKQTSTQTVLGIVSFNSSGSARVPAFIRYRWIDGRLVPSERL